MKKITFDILQLKCLEICNLIYFFSRFFMGRGLKNFQSLWGMTLDGWGILGKNSTVKEPSKEESSESKIS